MPAVGFTTFFEKTANTRFVVRNIAPNNKRIRIFTYPIHNDGERDLLAIPFVSEADIRHSLLKGELYGKIRSNEIEIIFSNIDLLQFDETQKQFLINAGVIDGLEVTSEDHDSLRDLIHFIDSGPAKGFISGSFREQLPDGDPFFTSVIWWKSSDKNEKIVELIITRDDEEKPVIEKWNMYAEDGLTITETITDTIVYSGPIELNRIRVIS